MGKQVAGRWVEVRLCEWMNRGWGVGERKDGWMDGRMEWVGRRKDEWMDG